MVPRATLARALWWQLLEDVQGLRGLEIQYCRQLSSHARPKRDKRLDRVVEDEKKLELVRKVKDVIVRQEGRAMTLRSLESQGKEIGMAKGAFPRLKRFPAVFQLYNEGRNTWGVRLTEAAEKLFEEERKLKADSAVYTVEKLRKFLMMSQDRCLALEKIAHFKKDFGLSEDWQTSILPSYTQYFKVVEKPQGPALELTSWDPLLAVSYAQKKADVIGSTEELRLPEGLRMGKKERVKALHFQQLPYQSPYEQSNWNPASEEAQVRLRSVVHELLSLTLEKRTSVDNLLLIRKEYQLPQGIRATLIRHPDMFYVSFKVKGDSVFLREGYRGLELIEKDPLVLAKERLKDLVDKSGRQMAKELRQRQMQSKVDSALKEEDEGDDVEVEDRGRN